ncbi:IS110 family transposase [Micromonospora foliorum]|uniref:IS110 family transposase n=1 Tax=Micromonospora foliorum TaxID=2911210 RepID=UPI001EE81BFF|nr:IS110 family transposase [Micromonospora foliorum]MCG5435392.1 IS110 family transposase [Micromonospora foliorum]
MTTSSVDVILGVDTHKHTHHAATIDAHGRLLDHREFVATEQGQLELLDWAVGQGQVRVAGVEGPGSYGAGLARLLRRRGIKVIDVNRPNRQARHLAGKNDELDAEQAARSVLSEVATAQPKTQDGAVEVIRMLRITRSTAIKARTQSMNALQAIIVTAPDPLREQLRTLSGRNLIKRCASLRPEASDLVQLVAAPQHLLLAGAKTALRELAQRWTALDQQIKALDKQLVALVEQAAPQLLALPGVGPDSAGQMLVTAGDNPERLKHEAAFARLCGVAPQPASSGRTTGRHRLSRGGDREANRALYMIIITRLRRHAPTKAYLARRTSEGLSKREIIRCLKRYLAREIYAALTRTTT